MSSGLVFYPASHRYKLDGQWVPSVTTILGVLNKPALPKWAAGAVASFVTENPGMVDLMGSLGGPGPLYEFLKKVPDQRRDDAASRGTKFHDYAERIVKGEEVEVPPEQEGMVQAALDFFQDWGIKERLVEEAIGSRTHRYAGKLDLVADHNNGPTAIFDWKSGKAIYPSVAWQLNAYGGAEFYGEKGGETPMSNLGIREAYAVHITDDGYTVYPLAYGPEVYRGWLSIVSTYEANKKAEGNWKVPGSGYVGIPVNKKLEQGSK